MLYYLLNLIITSATQLKTKSNKQTLNAVHLFLKSTKMPPIFDEILTCFLLIKMLQEQEITVKINKRESVNKSNLMPARSEIKVLKKCAKKKINTKPLKSNLIFTHSSLFKIEFLTHCMILIFYLVRRSC